MPGIALDASVTVSWVMPDESDPVSDLALDKFRRDGAVVPQLWHIEVRNALFQAQRRGRITLLETRGLFLEVAETQVVTDYAPDYDAVLDLAELHDLSIYDALYLELAKRSGLELATLESRLGQAAAREGLLMATA